MKLAEANLLITHTISAPEVIWTSASLFGLVWFTRLAWRASGDLLVLRIRKINSIREYAATTTLILFTFLWTMYLAFSTVGLIAMLLPSPDNKVQPLTLLVTTIFLILDAMGAMVGLIVDRRKNKLIKMIAKIEEMEK